MRMVVINKRAWAVGLHWMPPTVKRPSREELTLSAENLSPDFDMLAMRHHQTGFGASGGDCAQWSKVRSLAGHISLPSGLILGLFCLEDVAGEEFWWVFARRDAINVGMGDQVFSSREEANQEIKILRDTLKISGSEGENVVCETPQDSSAWLAPLCGVGLREQLRGSALLRPITPRKHVGLAGYAVAAGLGLCALWGVDQYLEYRSEQAAIEQSRLLAAAREQRRQQVLANPAAYFDPEWQKAPPVDHVGIACMDAILALPTAISGWSLESAVCNGGSSLVVHWRHGAESSYAALPAGARLESPTRAVVRSSVPVSLKSRSGQSHAGLETQEEAKRFLYQICQTTGTRLRLSFQPPQKKSVDKVEITAPWVKGSWELSSIAPALMLSPGLSQVLVDLPGLTLDGISLKNESWTFQGRIYAKAR